MLDKALGGIYWINNWIQIIWLNLNQSFMLTWHKFAELASSQCQSWNILTAVQWWVEVIKSVQVEQDSSSSRKETIVIFIKSVRIWFTAAEWLDLLAESFRATVFWPGVALIKSLGEVFWPDALSAEYRNGRCHDIVAVMGVIFDCLRANLDRKFNHWFAFIYAL